MVSKNFSDLSIRSSLMIDESNASATNTDTNITQGTIGMFVSPSGVTGRATVTGLPLVASNEYGKLEYSTIANVTQLVSINTGVTASGQAGVITTFAAATVAQDNDVFTVTNTLVTATSVILLQLADYSGDFDGTDGTPLVFVDTIAAGSFDIIIYNAHATTPLNGTLDIHYSVIG